ncbi:aspartyl protease family protein [Arenimonas sp.]|uniref:aspartyl protease family protein n=1 Tax=Arenimonas sp. TaxID=1872635 RepID=UPI0035B25132
MNQPILRMALGALACLLLCTAAMAASPAATDEPEVPAAGTVRFADGRRNSGWLDFEFFREQRIFLPARVNGRDTMLLLDSGAEMSVLDSAFAESLGLARTRNVTAKGTGGTQDASFLPALNVEIGNLRLDGVAAAAVDLSGVSAMVGHALPVVLGNEVFAQATIEIDFAQRRIRFHDPASFRPPAGFRSLAATHGPEGIRRIPATLEGEGPLSFDFDLGNGSPVLVSAGHWRREGWLVGRRTAGAFGGGIGGMQEQRVTRVKSLELAGFRLRDLPATLLPAEVSNPGTSPAAGNLGLPVFRRFHLVVDYPRDRLLLRPAEDAARPFMHDRSGLYVLREDGALKVAYVVPESAAAQAGWQAGDLIETVNGTPVRALADPGAWRLGQAGTTVRLGMRDGSTRALVLADYL